MLHNIHNNFIRSSFPLISARIILLSWLYLNWLQRWPTDCCKFANHLFFKKIYTYHLLWLHSSCYSLYTHHLYTFLLYLYIFIYTFPEVPGSIMTLFTLTWLPPGGDLKETAIMSMKCLRKLSDTEGEPWYVGYDKLIYYQARCEVKKIISQ